MEITKLIKGIFIMSLCAVPAFGAAPDGDNPSGNKSNTEILNPDEADFSDSTPEFEALFNVNGYDIVDRAMKYLGTPYRRGSMGPRAFDCSGFTSYVYKTVNISLNRSSRTQYKQGVYVKREELRPGDLVFFAGSGGGRSIGHVGIVSDIEADGSFSFIHASVRSGVKVDNINQRYYSSRYIGAKRILDY